MSVKCPKCKCKCNKKGNNTNNIWNCCLIVISTFCPPPPPTHTHLSHISLISAADASVSPPAPHPLISFICIYACDVSSLFVGPSVFVHSSCALCACSPGHLVILIWYFTFACIFTASFCRPVLDFFIFYSGLQLINAHFVFTTCICVFVFGSSWYNSAVMTHSFVHLMCLQWWNVSTYIYNYCYHSAQLVEQLSFVQRLWPCCGGPGFRSWPVVLCCVLIPLAVIVFPVISQYVLSKKSNKNN